VIPWLEPDMPFPPIDAALDEFNGLLAASAEITPERLLDAYRQGIFPWYDEGQPVLWWSPNPRMVLLLAEFRQTRSLRKAIRQGRYEIRVDSVFRDVIRACAAVPRRGQSGTWITSAIVESYAALFEQGNAHSVEAWRNDRLVGGLYGVAVGRMFFGESMFALEPDASKVALANLVAMLRLREFPLIDCQQQTAHLASLGARAIPRGEFAERVAALVNWPAPAGRWTPAATSDVLA